MNELIENVVKFYQSRFDAQIKYDSKTAKTIVVEGCELKLRQLNPGAVLIVYKIFVVKTLDFSRGMKQRLKFNCK